MSFTMKLKNKTMHAIKQSPTAENKRLKLDYASTHKEIVEKCKRGNRRAQFELYRLYSRAMYNICLRMVQQEQEAEDLLQDSFVDIFSKLHTFRYQSSIGAWIKRIVVNNCINHLKRNRLLFEQLEPWHTGIEDAKPEPDEVPAFQMEQVKKAIHTLPDGYRVVFSLYLLEGYDHKEIGEILGVTEATSKSQYSRAKRKLRQILQTAF